MRKGYVAMVLLLLVGAACGTSNGDSTPSSPVAASPAGCTDATATDLSSDNPFTITIVDFEFRPDCFSAASASSITIENQGSVTHTFTIDDTQVDASIEAGTTFNGESAGLAAGTYAFHCRIHPQMTGTVIVV